MNKREAQGDEAVQSKDASTSVGDARLSKERGVRRDEKDSRGHSDVLNVLRARNNRTDDVIDNLHRMLSEQVLISPPSLRGGGGQHTLSGASARRVGRTRGRQVAQRSTSGRMQGRSRRDRIAGRIAEIQELNTLALAAGIEVSEGSELLSRATRAFHSKDLGAAERLVSRAEKATRLSASKKIKRLNREVRAGLSQLEAVCGPNESVRLMLSQSKEAMRRRDHHQALEALGFARRRVRDAQNEKVLGIILDGKEKFVIAKRLGLDMDRAVDLLNKSRDSLRQGRFADSVTFANEGSKLVDSLLEVHKETRHPLTECMRAVKLAQALGADSQGLELRLSEASRLTQGDDLAAADESCKTLLREAEAAAHEKAAECYGLAEKALSLSKSMVGEVPSAQEKLDLARQFLEKGDLARSVSMASASMLESDSAISSLIHERFAKIEEFAKGIEKDVESLTEVQDAIETSRQRNMEHLKQYVELSQKIVGEAYENAAAYARVAQDVVKQAYERSSQAGAAKEIEVSDSTAAILPKDLDIPEQAGPEDRRQRLVEMYLSGKISESQLNRLLMMIDSSVAKDKLV